MLSFYLAALETDEERDIFTKLYEEHHQLLMKTAMKLLGSQELAEEAVHDVFLSAISQKEQLLTNGAVNFRSWSVVVIKRKCYDIFRIQKRKGKIISDIIWDSEDIDDVPSDELPIEIQIIKNDDIMRLMDCISEIEPLSRLILEMKYLRNMSFDEICEELDLTFAQVNGRLARTRQKVRALFEGDKHERTGI